MVLMDSFKHYNKILIKKENSTKNITANRENDGFVGNKIYSDVNKSNPINTSVENTSNYTPSAKFKQRSNDINNSGNFTTLYKTSVNRPPSMRIKRSSSKKNKTK